MMGEGDTVNRVLIMVCASFVFLGASSKQGCVPLPPAPVPTPCPACPACPECPPPCPEPTPTPTPTPEPTPTPTPAACPPSMEGWGDVKVFPRGNPYDKARLDFTSMAYPPWCREKLDRVFCPVPPECAEALVGTVTVTGEPGSSFNSFEQFSANTHLWNFEGWGNLRVCGGVPTQRCAVCEGVDDAGVGHDHVTIGWAKCRGVE